MNSKQPRPGMRPSALMAAGALARGETNPAQVRKVLRPYTALQKAAIAAELLASTVGEFPGAFNSLTAADAREAP
jgi:hypothetical protein